MIICLLSSDGNNYQSYPTNTTPQVTTSVKFQQQDHKELTLLRFALLKCITPFFDCFAHRITFFTCPALLITLFVKPVFLVLRWFPSIILYLWTFSDATMSTMDLAYVSNIVFLSEYFVVFLCWMKTLCIELAPWDVYLLYYYKYIYYTIYIHIWYM